MTHPTTLSQFMKEYMLLNYTPGTPIDSYPPQSVFSDAKSIYGLSPSTIQYTWTTIKNELEAVKVEAKEKANRHNNGKPQLSYIHLGCFTEAAKVMDFGAKKYGRGNWLKGQPLEQLIDSLLRHVAALQSGEHIDPESGCHHIGHIQANAMFLGLWLKQQQEEKK